MTIATKVIAIRYAYRTDEHESGDGVDGFVVLQETDGTRHAVIIFEGALGMELLQVMRTHPGEPVIVHELFVDVLRSAGTKIESLSLFDTGESDRRNGAVTIRDASGVWSRQCGAYDIVGLSIATGLPILIKETLFAQMHDSAPDLKWILQDEEHSATENAERLALLDDDSHLGKA